MDTQTLTDALRALNPENLTWKFALYTTLKNRDGLALEWNCCPMEELPAQAGKLTEFLLKKPVAEKHVAPYSPVLSDRENIAALSAGDELVQEQIGDIILNIRHAQTYAPEDYVSGLMPRSAGYAFYGERRNEQDQAEEQVLFMRRGNPFLTGANAQLYTSAAGAIVACEKPVLKFTAAVDCLLIGGVCYFFSAAVQKDFSLEDRRLAIAAQRLALIAEAAIVSDYDRLERVVMSAKNARKFLDFDKQILEHIVRLSIVEREEFLSVYGLTIDRRGLVDTYDPEQGELFVDLLCCRSCLDPLGRLSVGSNITPRQ